MGTYSTRIVVGLLYAAGIVAIIGGVLTPTMNPDLKLSFMEAMKQSAQTPQENSALFHAYSVVAQAAPAMMFGLLLIGVGKIVALLEAMRRG